MKSASSQSSIVFERKRSNPQKAVFVSLACMLLAAYSHVQGLPVESTLYTAILACFFLILAACSIGRESLSVNRGGILLRKDAFLSFRDSSRFYSFEEVRGVHFVRTAADEHGNYTLQGSERYNLAYTNASGKSVSILENLSEGDTKRISLKLCPHLPSYEAGASLLVVNSSFRDFIDSHSMVFKGMFIIPFMAVLGFSSFSNGSTLFETALSAKDSHYVMEELSPECEGKKYCIVSFFAEWCPVSRSTKRLIPTMERYFQGRDDVALVTFMRKTRWGQSGAEEEEWQRDLQRTLLHGLAVPGFVVLKDGRIIESSYKGGIAGALGSEKTVEEFLTRFLDAEYLLKDKKS